MRRAFLRDEGANAAVEFAIIVPILFTLILAIISICAMYFSQASMHQAAEWAARYWAVSDSGWSITSSCTFSEPSGSTGLTLPVGCTTANTPTFSTPVTYAKAHYYGVPLTGLTFTPSTGVCTNGGGTFGGPGVIMTATGTYTYNALFIQFPMTLTTQACYPIIE